MSASAERHRRRPPRREHASLDVLIAERDDELRAVLVAVLESFDLHVGEARDADGLAAELCARTPRAAPAVVVSGPRRGGDPAGLRGRAPATGRASRVALGSGSG